MIFAILNSIEFPIPRTHYLHVKKLAYGFIQNGYKFIEIKKVNDIKFLSKNCIVYISSHFFIDKFRVPFRSFLLKKLAKVLSKTPANLLLWSFHDIDLRNDFISDKSHLYLTENYSNDWVNNCEKKLKFYDEKVFYKLEYSSYMDDRVPYKNLNFSNNKICFDFNFIGSKYKIKTLNKLKNDKFFKSQILFYPPIQNEIIIIQSFGASKINLVYHSNQNIKKGFFTERFPEALSLGNIVVHDHPDIQKNFKSEGIVFSTDLKYIKSLINEISLKKIRELSFQNYLIWQKSELSYRKQAQKIIKKFRL